MKKSFVLLLLFFAIATLAACSGPPQPTPEEEAVLNSLKMVQQGFDRRVTADEFALLLTTASGSIEQLKKANRGNSCFLNAANRCYASYRLSQKAWKLKEEAQDESRRVDLETTLSFTIGFASISLAKANECFLRQ
jgi:hypothetical protein